MESWDYLRRSCSPPESDVEIPPEARRVFNQAMGAWIAEGAHGFWLEPKSEGHSNPKHFVCDIAGRLSALSAIYDPIPTQSPIEDQLLGALLWLNIDWAGFPKPDFLGGPDDHCENFGASEYLSFWITPQAKVGTYKADFLLWFHMGRHIGGIAVECDGHAFHEKNKEQASRDKARDRTFLKAGFPVMRFSGSDIFKDPLACAADVREALAPILDRVSRDGGLFSA